MGLAWPLLSLFTSLSSEIVLTTGENMLSWAHHALFVVCVIILPGYPETHSLLVLFSMAQALKTVKAFYKINY